MTDPNQRRPFPFVAIAAHVAELQRPAGPAGPPW